MDKIILEDVKQIVDNIRKGASILQGKTLMVTGGAGFICSYFLDVVSFLNENYFDKKCKLICLDNLISANKKRISHLLSKDYFEFIKHDISIPFSYPGEIDFIIHGASIASPSIYRKYPIETIDANVLGARYLLDLAKDKKVKSFLFLSSSETYGDPLPGNIPTSETYRGNVSFTGPRACYDESKRLTETLCMAFFRKHNIPVKIARPFNLYGPGQRLEDKRVIPDFINNALKNEPIVMYSDGSALRTFSYVGDVITGFFRILLSNFNGEAFNVGNDSREISMLELAKLINELFGNKLKIIHRISKDADYLKDNPQRRCPDLTKIRKLLNYEPKTDLRTGLRKTIKWAKETYNFKET